jgi:hypothetical protein
MKISELKQPYRRMAEYLADKKIVQNSSYGIYNFFTRGGVMDLFCNSVDKGSHPEITEEIKRHFPSDFDFSGEEQPLQIPNNPIIQNRIYTQLAKEGRFDELPDTCEFLEAVELEVWDNELSRDFRKITGKFKGNYMDIHCIGWKFAQLPTKKIDFTQFKAGDVVEVEEENLFYGQLCGMDDYLIFITFGICENAELTKCIEKEKIKSITKIK